MPVDIALIFTPSILLPAVIFAAVTSITPGPNNMMLLASGVNFGLRRTLPHVFGIVLGCIGLMLMVGSGLGYVFARQPLLQLALMVVSCVYLLWLSWRIAFQPVSPVAATEEGGKRRSPMRIMEAALFQWINPKAWIMAVGFYSDYIPSDKGTLVILVAALLFGVVNVPCTTSWALLGANLSKLLRSEVMVRRFNYSAGALLAASLIPILHYFWQDLPKILATYWQ